MKLLVLGGKGFLGSSLMFQAIERDITVYGTTRSVSDNKNIIKVDDYSRHSLNTVIAEVMPDAIVWTLMSNNNEADLINLCLNSLLAVINPETKLIFISTDAVFTGLGDYIESDNIGLLPGEAPLSVYVNAKHKGEKLIKLKHKNHIIIRTGPLYGDNYKIEKRTIRIIQQIKDSQEIKAATNLYRTFVHVDDIANAILELFFIGYKGTLHIGPAQKISYYTFFRKRLEQLQIHSSITPYEIDKREERYVSLDTSLNTRKANKLLQTTFRSFFR